MATETLSEITGAEVRRRQRALAYESLQGSQVALQNNIKRLEQQSFGTSVIVQILELAGQVPAGVLTESRSSLGLSIPGGIGARMAITQVAEAALADGRRREASRLAALKEAKAKLAKVEKDLEAFA